jgi:uncharacterized protein (TIGR02271 family)
MQRTVTAMFDSRSDAEAARSRLQTSHIEVDNIRIIDQSSASSTPGSGDGDGKGFFAHLRDLFLPDEDAHAYGEGIGRGSYLLCVQVDDDRADEAIQILEIESNSVDFDRRQDEWRSQGWTGFSGYTDTGVPSGAGMGASGQNVMPAGAMGSRTDWDRSDRQNIVDEERLPVVEEELRVGKREVTRGGARVRSYIREVPVHEQVNLREEHVSVERRPVDRTLSPNELGGDLLRERDIELTETAEEAVVAKEARVREELVVRKTAEEHVETIDDTVRRTEVEVDENYTGRDDRSAFGFRGGTSDRSDDLSESRSDFERTDRDRL